MSVGGVRVSEDRKTEKIKELCKSSLYFLCTSFLGYKDWDVVHDDVEKFLVKPAARKALLLPRGHLKSSLVTIGYSIQRMLENPNVRILIANNVWDMSRKFLSEIKGLLEGSQLKYIFGDFRSERWNQDDCIVAQRVNARKESTFQTTGIEAEQTGGHYDVIILDDLTGFNNSQTADQREKTKRYRRSMINLLEPGGTLIEIGTRWHLDDTFSVIFESEMEYYDVMVRKVVEDGKIIFPKHFSKKFDRVRKNWVETPTGNDMDFIEHLKRSMPIDEFYAQYLNEPVSTENQTFKGGMFRYWNRRPEGLYTAMAVDLAISQMPGADRTAMVVTGMDKEHNVYVLDYLTGRWTPSQVVENMFKMQATWKPFNVGIETNGFQRMMKTAIEEEMRVRRQYFGIEEIRTGPERSKENRIKSLEPFYRQGKVYHSSWMQGKELETELLTFPKGKHDDICDALAMNLPLLSPGVETKVERCLPGTYGYALDKAHRDVARASWLGRYDVYRR